MQDLRIAEGVPNRVAVDTRKLLRAVARTNSTCGILAHNHPTGLAIPSEADRLTTYHIMEVTGQLGFTIMDHIIIAGEDGCSMLNRGSLPEYRVNSGVLQAASRSNAAHAPCRVPAGRVFCGLGTKYRQTYLH